MNKPLKTIGIVLIGLVVAWALAGCTFGGDRDQSQPQTGNQAGGDSSVSGQPGSDSGSNPAGQEGQPASGNEDKFIQWDGVKARILTHDYPAEITKYLEEHQEKETQQALNIDNRTYLVLTMGQQPSAGYGIELKDLTLQDGTLKVYVQYKKPGKDEITATVVTYPNIVIETDDIYEGHYLIEYEIQ